MGRKFPTLADAVDHYKNEDVKHPRPPPLRSWSDGGQAQGRASLTKPAAGLPTWQHEILVERYGSIGGGIRRVVEEVVTADVDLLDSSPTMLRLIADQLETSVASSGPSMTEPHRDA